MKRIPGVSLRNLVMIVAAPAALLLGVGTASAQWGTQQRYPNQARRGGGEQQILSWQGRVDREIRIEIRNGRAQVIPIGNNERVSERVRATGEIPYADGIVTVEQLEGRGRVDVVQQPDRRNGYTTIIRVRDPQSGAGSYRLAAYWQPLGGGYRNGDRRGY